MKPQHRLGSIALGLALLAAAAPARAQQTPPPGDNWHNETPEQHNARMQWWRSAKVGVMFRWGVYSVPAGTHQGTKISGGPEWMMFNGQIPIASYKQYARQFAVPKYDPDAWVRLAREAGARYLVMTAKDMDGFALFDSKATDWDAKDAALCARDLVKPMAEACKKQSLKLGLMYVHSQDWCHPGGGSKDNKRWDPAQNGDFDAFLDKIALPQLHEILSNYGDLGVLWFDQGVSINTDRAVKFLDLLAGIQPNIIINSRLGAYRGDFYAISSNPPLYYLGNDWELHVTLNDNWAYKADDTRWKDPAVLVQRMAESVAKGGNCMFIVGPTGEGEVPAGAIDRLRAVGAWLKINGEAIYDNSRGPIKRQPWGCTSQKPRKGGHTLYLHVFKWPADGKLEVPGLRVTPSTARILATGATVPAEPSLDGVALKLPATAPDSADTVIALDVDGELMVESLPVFQNEAGELSLETPDAELHPAIPGEGIKLEMRDNLLNVCNWGNPADWVTWEFRIRAGGNFQVEALMASEQETAFRIEVDGETLFPVVPGGGDSGKFKKVDLGELAIPAAGQHTLVVRPIQQTWRSINLRRLILTPKK